MDQTLTYDLAFATGQRRPRVDPEIIFIIAEQHLPKVIRRLQLVIERHSDYIRDYLEDDISAFAFPLPDLFGNRSFGYRDCGYVAIEDAKVYFRLPMRPYPWTYRSSLSIDLLTKALLSPFVEDLGSGRKQDMGLRMLCDRKRVAGHGHSVGGWICERVMVWLKDYAKDKVVGHSSLKSAPMHPAVIQAQQATWHAINVPEMKKYASPKDIASRVYEGGSFILKCFGDACDVGVYPGRWSSGSGLIELQDHNLDTTEQQLTLLAGLAKLCQLSRESY